MFCLAGNLIQNGNTFRNYMIRRNNEKNFFVWKDKDVYLTSFCSRETKYGVDKSIEQFSGVLGKRTYVVRYDE